jgi:hypothetical protein
MIARLGRSADQFLEPTAKVRLGGALILSGDAAAVTDPSDAKTNLPRTRLTAVGAVA